MRRHPYWVHIKTLTMSRIAAAYEKTERLWWGMSPAAIVTLVAALTLVRFIVAHFAGLLWDEPYYWLWSRDLAAGYYDHPPMVAYWIWAGTAILGDGPLGIRLLFVLNTIATTAAAYGIGRVLFTERIAWIAALWVNVTPLLGIAGLMATPDGPSVLFWTLTVLALAMVVKTERGAWWLAVGAFAGLGLVSKYTNFFLGLGIILALLLDPRLRRWLASPWLWLGGAVALLIFTPVVMWNASHDWLSFRFQFGRLGEARFTPVYLLTLLVVQPLIINPLAFVFVVRAARLWAERAVPYGREIGLLIATALPAAVFIVVQSTHGEVLQHWLAPVFPTLTVAAVAAASTIDERRRWLLRRIRTDVVPFALIVTAVIFAYATLPLDRYFPGKDPVDSIRGWPAYAEAVEALRIASGAEWIATVEYEVTAELAYELRNVATVLPVTQRPRYTFLPPPDPALTNAPTLLIGTPRFAEAMLRCFAEATDLGEVVRYGAARQAATTRAYRVTGAAADVFARGCDGEVAE